MLCQFTPRITAAASLLASIIAPGVATVASAQDFTTDDPVVHQIWDEGMNNSHTELLAQALLDYIGPRLAGSPELAEAQDWLLSMYGTWGVEARAEQYGSWRAWRQGTLHVDLISPRVQTLEADFLAWSPGTDGPIEGEVVAPPADIDGDDWLAGLAGKYVLMSAPEPTCRAPHELEVNARPETVARLDSLRSETRREWARRWQEVGDRRELEQKLNEAGIAGILTSYWSEGWGVTKVFSTGSERAVALSLSCEDYGMLARMAERSQAPRIRVDADAEDLGMAPQFNVIAELTGTELPNEYVLLSAHLDSWHAATGATDNGTGTLTMLEAMRLLKTAYPNPRRTILVGHWGAEEMGLIGSRSFTEDHPEVIDGLQVAFNQDNGTWRIERIEGQGFAKAGGNVARWMSLVPSEISGHVTLEFPGRQQNSGSDHSSFICHGAPAFRLQSAYDEYRQYTWHTNRDTYDKIVFDDLKENATLAAMLAYAASEDPERVPRDRAVLPGGRDWPQCRPARRNLE